MPKRKNVLKIDGRIIKKNVPKKFRVGTRKSGKSAHMLSNDELKTLVERGGKDRNPAMAVLRKRGVAA